MIELFGTLGPACADKDMLVKMFAEGMSGIRLNLSHTSLLESREWLKTYHDAAKEYGIQAQLLIDIQGSELRIGRLEKDLVLENSAIVTFKKPGMIPVDQHILHALEKGDTVLLDDGKIEILIQSVHEDEAEGIVIRGGILSSRKSIKIQNKDIIAPVLTKQDIENIRHAKEYGVTALMQPFVRNGKELMEVKDTLHQYDCDDIRIFAKIENMTGYENLENIIPYTDMIVIARGDLGNDMPLWKLPVIQRRISDLCLMHQKPFLVVTQMLASMVDSPVPTRAEVSDIFRAVNEGASALMVTNETAVGKYPAEVIRYLYNTANEALQWKEY